MSITRVTASGVERRFRGPRGEWRLPAIDLVVEPGEVIAITGPTASGKTTLLNVLAGWDRPDAGTVAWAGASAAPPPWSELAVVPQRFALVDELDVIENITLARRAGTAISDDDVDAVVAALSLDRLRARSVEEISVGERQRVMIARALAGRPTVVVADEPVAHQDRRNADAVLGLLRDRAANGAACIVGTREADVAAVADCRIALG